MALLIAKSAYLHSNPSFSELASAKIPDQEMELSKINKSETSKGKQGWAEWCPFQMGWILESSTRKPFTVN